MARNDDDISEAMLKNAMDATEQEIAAAAFEDEPNDETGDRSLEEMDDELGDEPKDGESDEKPDEPEGDEEPEDDEDEPEGDDAEPEPPPAAQERARDPRTVALREERDRRQALERELAEMRGKVSVLERQPVQPQPAKEQPVKPDMYADPEGWEKSLRDEIRNELTATLQRQQAIALDESLADAKAKHGEAFDMAYQALLEGKSDPATFAAGQRIVASRDPGEALMRWHRQQETIRAVGTDPDAYRERIRQEVLAEMKTSRANVNGGSPRPQHVIRGAQRIPSLNGATGGGSHRNAVDPRGLDGSEEAIARYAFED